MRQLIAGLVAVVFAAIGAVVLGEYDLRGVVALVSGPLFGLAVTEVAISVARRLNRVTAGAVACISGLGFTWAVWIATDHYRDAPAVTAWVGLALAVGASLAWSNGAVRTGRGRPVEPANDSPDDKTEVSAPQAPKPT